MATKNVADITDSASGARGEDNFGRDSARRDSARRRSLRTNTQRGSVERPREPELETGEGHVNPTLRVVLQQLTNVLRPTELCRLLTSLRSVEGSDVMPFASELARRRVLCWYNLPSVSFVRLVTGQVFT